MKKTPSSFTDEQIISALESSDEKRRSAVFRYLCHGEKWIAMARKVMHETGSLEANFEDVFSISLMALIKGVESGKFDHNSSLSTYFYSICRFQFLSLKKKQRMLELKEDYIKGEAPPIEITLVDKEKRKELQQVVDQTLGQLGEPCASILKLKKRGFSFEVIAERLGYTNPNSAKSQASRCKQKLLALLKDNPDLLNKIKSLR